MLKLTPINREMAAYFVKQHHRHSKPTTGFKFAVAIADDKEVIRGVAIAGRPVARELDDGLTIEVLRVCTDGVRNGCSRLYGACASAAKWMGYRLAITYTLESETGASVRAAGFVKAGQVRDRQWGTALRPRLERDLIGDKVRWERQL